jgi:hypothetical protein
MNDKTRAAGLRRKARNLDRADRNRGVTDAHSFFVGRSADRLRAAADTLDGRSSGYHDFTDGPFGRAWKHAVKQRR